MFDTITILGTGLIGCSVLRAARERGLARRFQAWDIRPDHALVCEKNGWADAASLSCVEAVKGADLVVIAAPTDRVASLVAQIAEHLKPGAVVTDVGSTKGHAVRIAHAAMSPGRHFVGAHPMAGSEKNGPEASRADLFEGRVCFVTPMADRTDAGALDRVMRFWTALGSRVVVETPDEHDEIVAHVSHLPHALAVVLALTLEARPSSWRERSGGGLRDTTRVAGGDPDIWRAIFMENRHELVRAIDAADERLQDLKKALAAGDESAVRSMLARAREWRAGVPQA